MTKRTRSDRLGEYVRACRGFGLTDEEIASLNGGGPDENPEAVLREQFPETASSTELFERLRRTLVESRHGFNLPPTHEPRSAFVAVSLALEPYGCTFAVRDADGRPVSASATSDETFRLALADSAGNVRKATFTYPDGPFEETNVPALVHTVETELLVGVSKTFVLLSNGGDGWGFVLLDEEQLRKLRRQYGDRIDVFERRLLAPTQPPAYAKPVQQPTVDDRAPRREPTTTDDRAPRREPATTDDRISRREPATTTEAAHDEVLPLDVEVTVDGSIDASSNAPEAPDGNRRLGSLGDFDSDELFDRLARAGDPDAREPLIVGGTLDSVFEDVSDVRLKPMDESDETGPDGADGDPRRRAGSDGDPEAGSLGDRVLVGDDDGGSGPPVVGVGSTTATNADDALEAQFERFSEGLPSVERGADGKERFQWTNGDPWTADRGSAAVGRTNAQADASEPARTTAARSGFRERPTGERGTGDGSRNGNGRGDGDGLEDDTHDGRSSRSSAESRFALYSLDHSRDGSSGNATIGGFWIAGLHRLGGLLSRLVGR